MCFKSTIICEHIKSDQVLFIFDSEYRVLFVYTHFHAVYSSPEIRPFHKSPCQNTHILNKGIHTCIKKLGYKEPLWQGLWGHGAAGDEQGVSIKPRH